MNLIELKEYVRIVYELEVSLYQQKELIKIIESKLTDLGKRKNIVKPVAEASNTAPSGCSIFALIITGIIGICGMTIFFIDNDILGKIIGVVLVAVGFIGVVANLSVLSENNESQKRYEASLLRYYDEVGAENKRIESEEKQKEEFKALLPILKEKYTKSENLLEELYNKNVIYGSYRGIVPISSIYDYLMSGVCTRLGGHEGAYNKYDIESRLDRIITDLNVIITKLDKIQQNQFMLYRGVVEANNVNRRILSSVEQLNSKMSVIEKNSELHMYNEELIKKELEYRNYMDRKNGRWD